MTRLVITLEQMEAAGACCMGLEIFKSKYGDRLDIEWTPKTQADLMKSPLGTFLAWVKNENLVPLYDFEDADFSEVDFSGREWSGLCFGGCSFKGSVLKGMEVRFTQFMECNFEGVTLSGGMHRCSFLNCSFRGADLTKLRLANCCMFNCDLEGAKVDGMHVIDDGGGCRAMLDWLRRAYGMKLNRNYNRLEPISGRMGGLRR